MKRMPAMQKSSMKNLIIPASFVKLLRQALRRQWPLMLLAFGMAGCAGPTPIEAVAVLQHGQCQSIDSGVTRVDYADLARIRATLSTV